MPQNLAEKLAEIGRSIPNLLKQGDNGQYFYLRAIDVFEAVRVKLYEKGIIIHPVVQKSERSNPYLAITGDITDEWVTEVTYRITDGLESIDCCAHGIGQDHQGKALYIASTGAKKDLLKSLFLIAGYEDDAEAQENIERIPPGLAEKLDAAEKEFGSDLREHPIDRIKVNAWTSACRKTGFSPKAQKAFLKTCGVEKISDLKRKDFDLAMKWATGADDVEIPSDSITDTAE
jgi:hypothetical protein